MCLHCSTRVVAIVSPMVNGSTFSIGRDGLACRICDEATLVYK